MISVRDLVIQNSSGRRIVDGVSFDVGPGEAFGLVGESGSGKTTTALAVLGWVRHGLMFVSGTVTVGGHQLFGQPESSLRRHRGKLIAYVPQSAATALNPSLRVHRQIAEVLRHLPRSERDGRIVESLELANLPTDRAFQRRFPHQLSGGQQQRLGLAVALACHPKALVLDEPTTGLDLVTQQHVLDEVDRIRVELGIATISISHDLALVAARTDAIAVMLAGRIVESGRSRNVLAAPKDSYTRCLVEAVPDPRKIRQLRGAQAVALGEPTREPETILRVERLRASHKARHGTVIAADDVSFGVRRGNCLALVGESGSGKTTIARCIAGLHAPESGNLLLDDEALAATAQRRSLEQRRRIQIVFQDPIDSLNPHRTAHEAVARPLRYLLGLDRREVDRRVATLFERVRLPSRLAGAYPSELSGGECQRVAIARALGPEPEVLVCDEITAALDTSIQASVLGLIDELRRDLGLSLLFISHDLGVVASVADEVAVIERGRICEYASASEVLLAPSHQYTQQLLSAAPSLSEALVWT